MKRRISMDNNEGDCPYLRTEPYPVVESGLSPDSKRELILEKKDFPMTMTYSGKKYILILTKNDKLILNKYEE